MPRRHGIVAVAVVVVVVLANTSALAQEGAQNGEWRSHGGDTGHIQYAALDQINKDNLGDLEIVWRWASVDRALREQHEELRDRSARIFFHEVTPLKVGGTLYASTSLGQIAAIDPGTGETRWSVDPEVWRAGRPTNLGFLSKGLAYWTDDDRARLFYAGGAEATLVSVDPSTRALDPDFGDGGKVDLTRNLGSHVARNTYTLTSAPPVGGEAHNWYGGHRPGDNLFAQSVVCLDAETGERIWHFQLVHHPVWDWDPPAAPTLIDIDVDGRPIEAVAQVTKQGFLFVLDRVTGEPVWPIEERPVPQSTVPGEVTSATQPFPTRPAPFERQGISDDMLIDFTPELRAKALQIMQDSDGGPLYSPPSGARHPRQPRVGRRRQLDWRVIRSKHPGALRTVLHRKVPELSDLDRDAALHRDGARCLEPAAAERLRQDERRASPGHRAAIVRASATDDLPARWQAVSCGGYRFRPRPGRDRRALDPPGLTLM